MKKIIILLGALFVFFQYKLWVEHDSLVETWQLEKRITKEETENNNLQKRNNILQAEVNDLRNNYAAIEERARNELGMVKPGEKFYLFIEKQKNG